MFRLRPVGPFWDETRIQDPSSIEPPLSTAYRPVDEQAEVEDIASSIPDPDVVDRGVRGHKTTQNSAATFLRASGVTPLSPGPGDPGFDIGWWRTDVFYVGEVKSITPANETHQLRLALGQVLDYAHQIRRPARAVVPVIVAEHQPARRWEGICHDLGVLLAWKDSLERLLDPRQD